MISSPCVCDCFVLVWLTLKAWQDFWNFPFFSLSNIRLYLEKRVTTKNKNYLHILVARRFSVDSENLNKQRFNYSCFTLNDWTDGSPSRTWLLHTHFKHYQATDFSVFEHMLSKLNQHIPSIHKVSAIKARLLDLTSDYSYVIEE